MNRRRYLAAAGAAATLSLGGCLALTQGGGGDYDVGMTPDAFTPTSVTVARGEEVVWRNTSTRRHTVTAYEASVPEGTDYFASGGYDGERAARQAWSDEEGETAFGGAINSGESFSHTFEVPGRYEYFCIPHESGGMQGVVVVEDRTPTSSASE